MGNGCAKLDYFIIHRYGSGMRCATHQIDDRHERDAEIARLQEHLRLLGDDRRRVMRENEQLRELLLQVSRQQRNRDRAS